MDTGLRIVIQNQIDLALDGKVSWVSLASTLQELTSTSASMKLLIEILIETLKTTNTKLKSFETSGQVETNEDLLNQSEVEDSKDFPKTFIHHTVIQKRQSLSH